MKGPLTTFSLRFPMAAGALLALLGTAPAHAVTSTVYWDRADYGFGAGIGVSEGTATGSGIPSESINRQQLNTNTLPTTDTLGQNFVNGDPASITQQWSVTSNLAGSNTLFLVFMQPDESTLELDGETETIEYDPADVGLVISDGESGPDWVIFQTIASTGDSLYLPAVSLGTLNFGDAFDFSIRYSLQNPQVFPGDGVDKLGVPAWNLAFIAVPIPEPTSGLLMMMGLLAISRVRRKRA